MPSLPSLNQTEVINPWRANHEIKAAIAWGGAAFTSQITGVLIGIPAWLSIIVGIPCLVGLYVRGSNAYQRHTEIGRLRTRPIMMIKPEEMQEITKRACASNQLWLGKGFDWTDIEANKMHDALGKGVRSTLGVYGDTTNGSQWLHGLAEEGDILTSLANLVGHTLVVGTTRVGKTRLYDLLIQQAIFRGECVIIIDPKGDHGLPKHAKYACELAGQPERFVYFHPAHPSKSAAIDPMRNWNRTTEIASRIAALIPSETGSDPFTAFGWKVINDIVQGMLVINKRPNLITIRRNIENGPDKLVEECLKTHFNRHVPGWESRAAPYVKKSREGLVAGLVAFYKEVAVQTAPSTEIEGLISSFTHNRDHFSKMVASLNPIMAMLTSDSMGKLLSPEYTPEDNEERVVTNMAKIIRGKQVAYFGLDSLADGTVGSAIGSMILADLTAVAGDRYNHGIDESIPVNIFIDEAAEVINMPTIQLMNKAGGANFRVTIATQTLADFVVRLGSQDKARQVLGNTNNKIALRVLDVETQQYIAEGMPKIMHKSMQVRYGHSAQSQFGDEFSGAYTESLAEREAEMFPPAMLGELPPLHYLARFSGGRTVKGRLPILEIAPPAKHAAT